jgi:uncharacterized protein (DUF111 family)
VKVVYFDCPSGASGDMILGALLDAGVSLKPCAPSWASWGCRASRSGA